MKLKTSNQIFKKGEGKNGQLCIKKNFLRGIIQLKVNKLVKFVFPFVNPFGL